MSKDFKIKHVETDQVKSVTDSLENSRFENAVENFEDVLLGIFAHRTYSEIQIIFNHYFLQTGMNLEDTIVEKFSGLERDAYLEIGKLFFHKIIELELNDTIL